MAKISDEIREWCHDAYTGRKIRTANDLYAIADRIDAEMVELPKGADGKPIHVGDTVYGCRSGMKMAISELRMTTEGWLISTSRGFVGDTEVTHTRPDSWESIADELEELVDAADSADDRCEKLADIADRIRRLAAKEG